MYAREHHSTEHKMSFFRFVKNMTNLYTATKQICTPLFTPLMQIFNFYKNRKLLILFSFE